MSWLRKQFKETKDAESAGAHNVVTIYEICGITAGNREGYVLSFSKGSSMCFLGVNIGTELWKIWLINVSSSEKIEKSFGFL